MSFPAAAGSHILTLGFSSYGFAGIEVGYRYSVNENWQFGMTWRGSLFMMAGGDFDTGELALIGVYKRAIDPRMFVECLFEPGWRYQTQTLGTMNSLWGRTGLKIGYDAGKIRFGIEGDAEISLLTGMVYSDFVKDTFSGRYTDGGEENIPEGLLLTFSGLRFKAGGWIDGTIGDHINLYCHGGAMFAPNPYVKGFEGMMFGYFPFYANLGMRIIF